jgi:hypothetical protein
MRGFESRGVKDFTMSMTDAKDLHADITRLLITLQTLQESKLDNSSSEVITVQMDGGNF